MSLPELIEPQQEPRVPEEAAEQWVAEDRDAADEQPDIGAQQALQSALEAAEDVIAAAQAQAQQLLATAQAQAQQIALSAQEAQRQADEAAKQAAEQAHSTRERASAQAEEMAELAARDAEQLRQKAVEEGREEGYKAGFAAGREQGIAEYDAAVRDAKGLMELALGRIEQEREGLLFAAEQECVQLAQEIAQKVLGTALALDENAFPSLVRRGLAHIQHSGRVTVRVSPLEYDIFFSAGSGWLSDEKRTVTVVADEGLGEGDLILESEIESINAGVRVQLAAVRDALGEIGGGQ